MFEYDKDASMAVEKLDKYEFYDLLKSCYYDSTNEVDEVRDRIISEYPELESILDDLSDYELMEYLSETYNSVSFREVTTYELLIGY